MPVLIEDLCRGLELATLNPGIEHCEDLCKRHLMESASEQTEHGIDPEAAHNQFLKIDKYRYRISPDIKGAENDKSP